MHIQTPFGPVALAVSCSESSEVAIQWEAQVVKPQIALPPHMSVDGLCGCIVDVRAERRLTSIKIDAIFPALDFDSYPSTGEHLDCVIFENGRDHVAIAFRDKGWLLSEGAGYGFLPRRFEADDPWLGEGCKIGFRSDGLHLELGLTQQGERFRIPFAIAWSTLVDAETARLSAWFGVDAALTQLTVNAKGML